MLTYALPGSLVMAESLLVGASLINIFLAVWFVNARLYPMTVSLFPLMMHKSQSKWKYYFSCHFIAVSAWLIMKSNYKNIKKKKFEANTSISFLFQKMSLPLLQSSCIEIRKVLNNENFITQIFKQSAQAADVVQCAVGAGSSSCTQSKSMSSSCTRPTSWSSIGPRITSRNTLQHSLV
jgi:hypothetical protein